MWRPCQGAHSWVRKTFGITMDGEQTEYIWGVCDFVPDTDFPDIRNRTAIHSANGSCMIIPREEDKVRLYIQLSSREAIDANTGRVDKSRMGPDKLIEVSDPLSLGLCPRRWMYRVSDDQCIGCPQILCAIYYRNSGVIRLVDNLRQ